MSDRPNYDEAAAAIVGIYQRHANAFDRKRNRSLFEKDWLDRFIEAMPARPSVLNIGCGMGEPIAAYLASCGCRITGIDSSNPMLTLARQRLPDHRWLEADMRSISLGETFDGIFAWDSFFLLSPDDQRKTISIFAAHSKPDTALLFTSGPRADEVLSELEGETLYAASLDNAEFRALLAGCGFSVLDHRNEDPHCDCHTVWLAKGESTEQKA